MIDFQNAKKIIIPEGEVSIIARGSEILWRKQKYKQELAYLESTGTQWIDTGIYPANITYLEMEGQYTAINKRQTLMGCYDVSYNTFAATNPTSAYDNFFSQWSTDNYGGSIKADLNKHVFSFDKTSYIFSVDGYPYSLQGKRTDVNDTLYMFATHKGSTIDRQASAKVYYLKMYNGSELVRDFIPVLDMNNMPCMYDKVTDTFFYNKGTGAFNFEYKFEEAYEVLDYIESTGTQYIDTGLKLTSDYSVELDYQITSIPKTNERRGLFGGLDDGGVARYGSLVSPTTRKLEYGYGKGNTYYQTTIPTTDRCLLKQVKNQVYVDNSLIYTFPTATFTMQRNAYLGSFNYTNYTPMLAKYYSAKFWDGDTLVRFNIVRCLIFVSKTIRRLTHFL